MQQILQCNMGLSVVERLKTYDVEKVVSTFLGRFQSNSFRCREAGKHGQDVRIFTISRGIKSVRYRGKSPPSIIFRRFGSLVDVSGTAV